MSIAGAPSVDFPLFDEAAHQYDALLVASFGGPEGTADVIPFLENVTRGRGIPHDRLLEVAEHYYHFDGVSPINQQNRDLIAALERNFAEHGLDLPIYFGNRNWTPFFAETIAQMQADGVQRALVFVTSAFSSWSGCRQYREDLLQVTEPLGLAAPHFDKLRMFGNHPGFIAPMVDRTCEALQQIHEDRRRDTVVVFTAHSIPLTMAEHCRYEAQLVDAATTVMAGIGEQRWQIAYQSRSGSPHTPWLEPDISDVLSDLRSDGVTDVVVVPIGFISDHMEVLFDLDHEAKEHAEEIGITMVRAGTVGTHPVFVNMIRELVLERMTDHPVRRFVGALGPTHDICPIDCCLLGVPTASVARSA